MAEVRKIRKISTTLKKGKKVYTHFSSLKTMKAAKETKSQITTQFKEVIIDTVNLNKENLFLVYMIRKD